MWCHCTQRRAMSERKYNIKKEVRYSTMKNTSQGQPTAHKNINNKSRAGKTEIERVWAFARDFTCRALCRRRSANNMDLVLWPSVSSDNTRRKCQCSFMFMRSHALRPTPRPTHLAYRRSTVCTLTTAVLGVSTRRFGTTKLVRQRKR